MQNLNDRNKATKVYVIWIERLTFEQWCEEKEVTSEWDYADLESTRKERG